MKWSVCLHQNKKGRKPRVKNVTLRQDLSPFFFFTFLKTVGGGLQVGVRERKMPARGKSEVQVNIKEDKNTACARARDRFSRQVPVRKMQRKAKKQEGRHMCRIGGHCSGLFRYHCAGPLLK